MWITYATHAHVLWISHIGPQTLVHHPSWAVLDQKGQRHNGRCHVSQNVRVLDHFVLLAVNSWPFAVVAAVGLVQTRADQVNAVLGPLVYRSFSLQDTDLLSPIDKSSMPASTSFRARRARCLSCRSPFFP